MKVLISYCNDKYKPSQHYLKESAYTVGGVDRVISYDDVWLKTQEFYLKNKFILDQPRGAGYWIWKPFIILNTFEELSQDDVLLYVDAGLEIIENLDPLYDLLSDKNPKVFFSNDFHVNKKWTKKDTFVLMNCDEPKYRDGYQLHGGYHVWRNTEENKEFLKEYQRFLRDPRIVTDCTNMCGLNSPEFEDHRHDQSVLSLLSIKYELEIFRDPSQFGNKHIDKFPNSPYPQMFNHHRGFLNTLKFKELYS